MFRIALANLGKLFDAVGKLGRLGVKTLLQAGLLDIGVHGIGFLPPIASRRKLRFPNTTASPHWRRAFLY